MLFNQGKQPKIHIYTSFKFIQCDYGRMSPSWSAIDMIADKIGSNKKALKFLTRLNRDNFLHKTNRIVKMRALFRKTAIDLLVLCKFPLKCFGIAYQIPPSHKHAFSALFSSFHGRRFAHRKSLHTQFYGGIEQLSNYTLQSNGNVKRALN